MRIQKPQPVQLVQARVNFEAFGLGTGDLQEGYCPAFRSRMLFIAGPWSATTLDVQLIGHGEAHFVVIVIRPIFPTFRYDDHKTHRWYRHHYKC